MRFARICTLSIALSLAVATGCKEDPMVAARYAHANLKADEAETALKQVLSTDPKNFEARRLMADTHRFRGDFEETEKALTELWEEKGFGDENKDLPPEERAKRDLLEDQFNELYSRWSESLDAKVKPDEFERVVRSGLKWKPKSPTLNRVLVDHLWARGEALAKEGKKLEAAEAFEAILQLRAMKAQRTDATQKAQNLRVEAFKDGVLKSFEPMKAELVTAGQWNEETKTVTFTVETEVNKRWKQSNDAQLADARKDAAPAIREAIAKWIAKVTGVEPEVAAAASPKIASGDESLGRGKYSVKVSMTMDDLVAAASAAKQKAEAAKLAAEKKAEAPADDAEPAPEGAEGTNSGAADAGTTGKE